ncbi:MAG TPA: PSD1 and planctomycete cytochrome C domain-containing protein [Planctomycetaceae bacterium]|nr:PSD1 and planctomycete cytochrome C domain-containing protein [Planctomycetaceae bacterium]
MLGPRLLFLGAVLLFGAAVTAADDDPESLFETRVRPLLVETCFRCHGGEKTAFGLRVDSREALLKGGKNGPAVVPGKPDWSRLLTVLEYRDDGEFQMPPEGKLPAETIAAVALWIKLGAPWPETKAGVPAFEHQAHWAYQPVRAVEPPADPSGWSNHPVDRFITAAWQKNNLHPVPLADRQVLVRRLYFDLVGLPPSPAEVDQFLRDDAPDGWARLVDRLLASPRYGERWGRHWMDVVRYADTAGDNADYPVPEVRLYRDYIIDSFNADKPFDQFVREQVAGDLLAAETVASGGTPEKYAEQTIATGFLALSRRYATAPYELWHLTLEDTIDTIGRAFLGQTFKCARCHDHKFDPVTQEDYYGLYGIFASTQFPWAGGEEFASKQFGREHFIPLATPAEAQPRLESHAGKVKTLQALIRDVEQAKDREAKDQLVAFKGQLRELLRTNVPTDIPCAYAVCDGVPADATIQQKGDPAQPGPVVPRRMPALAGALPQEPISSGQSGRLQLAQWLTHPQHPLTARVLVNRVWLHHFGKGIVATPSNFGTRGDPPTHPELLDYLARQFVERGWSIKEMHRLILTSKVWQLSTEPNDADAALDPDNRFYWRFDRRRLDAEAIRDAMLTVAGTLDPARPGVHPFPAITTWTWTQHKPFKDLYPSRHRSVYLMTQRIQRHPFLALFDGPDTNTTTEKRSTSTVPLQALFWMNSPLVRDEAEAFARRLIAADDAPAARVRLAFQLAYSREPTPAEIDRFLAYTDRYRGELAQNGIEPFRAEAEAWTSVARTILSSNEFVYLD